MLNVWGLVLPVWPWWAQHQCVPFQAHLIFSVYFCVVPYPISPLGFCAGIDQWRKFQTAGASAHTVQVMMERTTKGRGRKKKNLSMLLLPGQTSITKTGTKWYTGGKNERGVFWMLPQRCLHKLVFLCERQCYESHTAHRKSEVVVDIREWVTKGAVGLLYVDAVLMSGLAKTESNDSKESMKVKVNLKLEE